MTNTIIYSPLEQFEFFLISFFPKIENIYLFFAVENTFWVKANDFSNILQQIFTIDYIKKLQGIHSIFIEGNNINIIEELEQLFIIENFKIGIFPEIWANLHKFGFFYFSEFLGKDISCFFIDTEHYIKMLLNDNRIILFLLENFSMPYFTLLNDIQYPIDTSIAYRFSTKDWSNFTIIWLNVYNSVVIVLVLFIVFFIFFNILGKNLNFLNIWLYVIDLFFSFLLQTFISLANKKLVKYFHIFCVFFIFIFLANLTALVPFSFCLTSNLWFTLTLSLSVWVSVTVLAIIVRGTGFFKGFVPSNVPAALKGFITIIEVISYVARAVSLGVRIFANMLAGHSLVHILSDLVETCIISFDQIFLKILGVFPAIILTFILFIEFGICFLQALVFVILTAIYLNEAFGFAGH